MELSTGVSGYGVSCRLYSGKLFLEEYAVMETKEKKGNFILNLSNIQKLFLLLLIFNLASDGYWVSLFTWEASGWAYSKLYLGANITCVAGFLFFWKVK